MTADDDYIFSPQPKPTPKLFTTLQTKADAARDQRFVYAFVAARDRYHCRCCGRVGRYGATDAEKNLHRHHVTFRSQGGADSTTNLLTLCARCHALAHAHQLYIVGTDADARIEFEILEPAVVEVFGVKALPAHVHIITARR